MTSRINVKLVKTKGLWCKNKENHSYVKGEAALFNSINISKAAYFVCFLLVFFSLCLLWKDCFVKYYTMWIITINRGGGSPVTPAFSSHGEIKLQETLQSKWEVQSYPVKAIKTEEARLSLHKLPEMESMGKYTEAHQQGLVSLSVCVYCTYTVNVIVPYSLASVYCSFGSFKELSQLSWTHSVTAPLLK